MYDKIMYRLAALALLATSVAAKGGCPSTDITLDDWVSARAVSSKGLTSNAARGFSHLRFLASWPLLSPR
jgi:hypothetical protein